MKRKIVTIDEKKCTGCGLCIPNCHEGALQIIDGKARLISDLMCDGLGACIGHCPEDAMKIEEREAEPYDEIVVIKDMIPKGKNTIIAHLQHLKEHNETGYLKQAVMFLEEHQNDLPFDITEVKYKVHTMQKEKTSGGSGCGCPGAQEMSFNKTETTNENPVNIQSELRQWPVQLHLVSKNAAYFRNADLLLAADCVAFSLGNFHQQYLKGKALAIACPKLDSDIEIYIEKLTALIDEAKVNTITVMIMEVPCCGGLLQMAKLALQKATRKVPLKVIVVGLQGEIKTEEWV
ncbi:MAG: 4Fe-4S dicluster domain-containing protein [Bacteroidia bacterium]|nr:4Fe-4S dicluster domain-containing protein [Bacteroidia bacterium]